MEDLASKLRRVLYGHQAELQRLPPLKQHRQDFNNDATIAFVSKMLLADEYEDDQPDNSCQILMKELELIITSDGTHQEAASRSSDVHSMLMQCARAVAANQATEFYELASQLKALVSPPTTALDRGTEFFLDALVARLNGTGPQTYRSLAAGISTRRLLSMRLLDLPSFNVSQVFANETILRECRGAKKVHIIDYGIYCGFQWPYVFQALSQRPEGPPKVKITAVELPFVAESSKTELRLVECASFFGVHLEYCSILSSSWERVQPSVAPDEFVVVNCNLRLRHVKDDTISTMNPRRLWLERIVRLSPKVFTISLCNANFNTPFFMPRFEAALRYYLSKIEYHEVWLVDQPEELAVLDRIIAKNIMNAVACEGAAFVERMDSYKSWSSRTKRAGFEPISLDVETCEKVRQLWSGYKNSSEKFTYGDDDNWLLLGWKDVVLTGMSAWRPVPTKFVTEVGRLVRLEELEMNLEVISMGLVL